MRPIAKFATRILPLMLVATICAASAQAQPVPSDYQPVFVDPLAHGLIRDLTPVPADGSVAAQSDIDMVLAVQWLRSAEQVEAAAADADRPAAQWASDTLGFAFSEATYPVAFRLFHEARRDLSYAIDLAKNTGPQRKRPVHVDARIKPALSYEGHHDNAWPAARAAATRTWAGILSDLFPEHRQALVAAAEQSAWLRVVGGVHYPTDLIAGYRLADAYLDRLRQTPAYQQRLQAARQEVAKMRHDRR